MQKKPDHFFWDAGGKFESIREKAFSVCKDCNLTVYSLTAKGATEPTHLVFKATPLANPEGYLSRQAGIVLRILDYNAIQPNTLRILYFKMNAIFRHNLLYKTPFFADLGLVNPNCYVYTGQGDDRTLFHRIPLEEFFSIDPREDEPGAKIYLRDKEFFLSALLSPQKPAFSALRLLTKEQREKMTEIDLSQADISSYQHEGCVFHGYKSLRALDLSALDTTGFTDMRGMFYGCESLKRLDLSTFDFSRVTNMRNMFGNCTNLEEVILPDTFRSVRCIPRTVTMPPVASSPQYTDKYLSDLSFDVYRSEGPQMAQMAVDRATRDERPTTVTHSIPVCEASEEEMREYLGLQDNPHTKLMFVPYRAPKKQTEPDSSPEKQTEPGCSPEYQKNRNLLQRLFQRK